MLASGRALEAEVQTFSVAEGAGRHALREALTKTPELKHILDAHGVQANNEVFLSRDVAALGRGFSLKVSDVTLRTILNRVIEKSETKYWIINRDGARKQYLLLNL